VTRINRRTLIFLTVTAALVAAAVPRLLATTYYVFKNPDGTVRRVAGAPEEWERWGDQTYDCRTGTCNLCGQCHQQASTLAGKRIGPTTHTTAYAKAAVRLAPGQRILWGADTTLRLERDRLCMFSSRDEKLLCYDPTSILIKDKSGRPSFVSWTRPPTLYGIKPGR